MAASCDVAMLSFSTIFNGLITDLNEDFDFDDEFDMIVTTIVGMKKWERKDIVKIQGYFENVIHFFLCLLC